MGSDPHHVAESGALGIVDDLAAFIGHINLQDLDYEIRKLHGIKAWAMKQAGIDWSAGDAVRIKNDLDIEPSSGWWPYREALAVGATAQVRGVDFNLRYDYWYATVLLDREWSVTDFQGETRWWHGVASETPEGMTVPSAYDQQHHPEGTRGVFAIPVKYLERGPQSDGNGVPSSGPSEITGEQ